MYAMKALDSISQSDEEWRRERDYIDAVNTEISIRETAISEGLQQGIQQGIEQGIQQGTREATIEAAKNFYKNGAPKELITKSLNITLEELEEILKGCEKSTENESSN